MKKNFLSLFLVLLISVLATSNLHIKSTQSAEKVPAIVGFKERIDLSLIESYGGEIIKIPRYSPRPFVAVYLQEETLEVLRLHSSVEYVETVRPLYITGEVLPWGVERIGGNIVWDKYPGDFVALTQQFSEF